MVVEAAFFAVCLSALVGLIASVGIEASMKPRPRLARPLGGWALHCGTWMLGHAVLGLLVGRPWFAAAVISAFLLTVVLVNNAKFRALREPFVLPDFEYFTDAIRHPRLYIPFLGWPKLLIAVLGFTAAIGLGLWVESVPADRDAWHGQLGGFGLELLLGTGLLAFGRSRDLELSFDPERDLSMLGLVGCLWRYAEVGRRLPVDSPAEGVLASACQPRDLPHLLAVQSESFFDVRSLSEGIRKDVLAEFDLLKGAARSHGKLRVPAWGANTVRSEFAFLSGLDECALGVHRFNPYRAVARGWKAPSLAAELRRKGYRTIAIHPYPASFYLRDRVYPQLGFDEFLAIEAFADAERAGPYVSDLAVARKIETLLAEADGPLFIFAVTMENHGPLHLEQVREEDIADLYVAPPPAGCEDLTIYLRHLRNADRMLVALRKAMHGAGRRSELCWYGDHVPIMPKVYEHFGAPDGEVDYLLYGVPPVGLTEERPVSAAQLAQHWLRRAGLTAHTGDHAVK